MPKLKLSYFDIDGGRGEPARLALFLGDVAYEDHRIPLAEWPKAKVSTPFGAVPVLEVDGTTLVQSNAINRYVGKLTGLYPDDPFQAAFCDETMDTVEEFTAPVVATFSIKDPAQLAERRAALVEGAIPFYLRGMQARLEARGGEWFADGRLTVADLKVFVWIRQLGSGRLDHIPSDLTARLAPSIASHCERVAGHEGVTAYYARRNRA